MAVYEWATGPAFEIIPSFDRLDTVDHRLTIHKGAVAFGAPELGRRRVRVGCERRGPSGLHGVSMSARTLRPAALIDFYTGGASFRLGENETTVILSLVVDSVRGSARLLIRAASIYHAFFVSVVTLTRGSGTRDSCAARMRPIARLPVSCDERSGRDGRIRTGDPLTPSQVRYPGCATSRIGRCGSSQSRTPRTHGPPEGGHYV